MFRSLGATARAAAFPRSRPDVRRPAVPAGLASLATLATATLAFAGSPAAAAVSCDRSATTSTFASTVSAAAAGDTICLASGNYGTWAGTNKAVTIAAADGASPQMKISFASGDSGFTLDGLTGMGGTITGASNVTIRNSSFSSTLDIEGSTAGVVIDRDQFTWNAVSSNGGPNAKIFLHTSGTLNAPAVTISNSSIINGDLDGIHVGGGSGVQIVGNTFSNLCDRNVNHTDNIQFEGGTQVRIAQNYFYAAQNCPTQGVTSYDSGTNGVIIEDNVVDVPRDWGIELYADKNSIVRHNTVVYHPKSYSEFNTGTGQIDINRKSQDPAGSGTQVYDNLTSGVSFANGSTGTQHNNINNSTARYVGPTTQWAGFKLAADSPVGRNAASDGADAGVRVAGGTDPQPTPTPSPSPSPTPSPSPSPTPTPPPNDHPAAAVWTAPSSATVGTPVTLDGTRSTGDGTLSCTWSFENADGSTIWETQTGCKLQKAFTVADTKYVNLIVRDADGDTNANKQAFAVTSAPAPAPTPTPEPPAPTPSPTPDPTPAPTPDQPAHAVMTMPRTVHKGVAVTFDGTKSTGDGTVTCTWTFTTATAQAAKKSTSKSARARAKARAKAKAKAKAVKSQVVKGCTKRKTFDSAGTSSVKLVVRDTDGDSDSMTRTVTVRR